jgi:hypothetical protein
MWRQALLSAARSLWAASQALLPLANAVEEAQLRAERALTALRTAEEQRHRVLASAEVGGWSGGGVIIRQSARREVDQAEDEYRRAHRRAERECADAFELVQMADRAAAIVVEAEALRAPVPIPPTADESWLPPSTEHGPGVVGSFVDGAWKGDFADDHSWSALTGQVVIGFVPVAGQIADGRDIVAAIRDRDWERLPLVALGVIPGLDFLKAGRGLTRVERGLVREAYGRGLDRISEEGLQKLAMAERLSNEACALLRARLVELEVHRAVAIARLDRIATMDDVPTNAQRALQRAGNGLKDHLKTRDLIGAMRDMAGVPVMKGNEQAFAHHQEVGEALANLEHARDQLINSFPNGSQSWGPQHTRMEEAANVIRQMQQSTSDVTGVPIPRR